MTKQVSGLGRVVWILLGLVTAQPSLKAEDPAGVFFEELKRGGRRTVVFYGTSLTHSGSWTRATQEWFDAKFPGQVSFVNSGGPGQNSDWGLKQVTEKVLAHQPDLVVVEFSYNDAHTKFQMPVERGYQNLEKMVSVIREKNPRCVVVLQVMNPPWDAPGKSSATDRPDLKAFNGNYRRLAGEQKLPLLDHYPEWKKLEQMDVEKFRKFIPDGSHPTGEAGRAVVWPTIQRWLEEQVGENSIRLRRTQ